MCKHCEIRGCRGGVIQFIDQTGRVIHSFVCDHECHTHHERES